jgi:serine/threonine protein kinase
MAQIVQTENLDDKFKQGTVVGNYVIVNKVGTGGIGAVYQAQHKLLNYKAALKIHQHFSDNEVVGVAFLQAANYLSQLTHPNIVRLYDYGFFRGYGYMAMEFIEGTTLDKIIPKTQTTQWVKLASEYFVQLLSAVRHAHNCVYLNLAGEQVEGIIHGDIKPQNIFITKDGGRVKLADFMIPDVQEFLGKEIPDFEKLLAPYAKPLSPRERARLIDDMMDETTAAFGTPRYMPPEQQEGKVSVQTDIFTLGATLYEILTNRPPMSIFEGITPRKINPFVPSWMENAVVTAMKPDPSDRFYSVAEMESVFREHIEKPDTQSINFVVKEILMGDKIDIKMGDVSNVSGQLFIGKFNEVVANLNNSGQTEFAEALKTLKDAVMASQHIPDEKKKDSLPDTF